jgi:hypothetical protein
MRETIVLLTVSAAIVSGCAAPPPRAPSPETFIGYITPHIGASARNTYKVTTLGITSSQAQISRVDEGFRGVVQQLPIDLRVEKGEVTGSLNGQPIDLRIEHKGGKLWVDGLYGGRFASFFFSETPGLRAPGCQQFQPWISSSTSEDDAELSPASCDEDSIEALGLLRSYLDEGDAAALLAVMLLSGTGSSGSRSGRAPPAPRALGLASGGGMRPAAPAAGHH